jgi:hypothetical protein
MDGLEFLFEGLYSDGCGVFFLMWAKMRPDTCRATYFRLNRSGQPCVVARDFHKTYSMVEQLSATAQPTLDNKPDNPV